MAKPSPGTDDLLEELAEFKFPRATQRRFTRLMDLNSEGGLSPEQRQELAGLVELSERIAIMKGRARLLLDRKSD